MAEEISGVGKGFFSASGQLKSKEQLQESEKKERQNQKVNSSNNDATIPEILSSALGSTSQRFEQQVSSAQSTINMDQALVEQALELVEKEIELAEQLQTAKGQNDQESIEKTEQALNKVREQRVELAKKAEDYNNEMRGERSNNISIGNKQLATIRTKDVEISAPERKDNASSQNSEQLLSKLETERRTLVEQKNSLGNTERQLNQVVNEGRAEIQQVSENTIRTYEQAQAVTQRLVGEIQSGSQQMAVHRLTENVVKSLTGSQ